MTAVPLRPVPAQRRRLTELRRLRLTLRSRRASRWRAFLHIGWLPKSSHPADREPHDVHTPQPTGRRATAINNPTAVKLSAPGVPSILTSRTTWDVASKFNRALAPIAVTLDAARLGLAARKDRGIGRNVARTGASIAGSWAGGYAGGVAGSHTGAMIGAAAGPVGVLLGGLTGGLVGAVAGAIGLSKVSEKGVNLAASVHDARRRKQHPGRRRTARPRWRNRLRRGWFRQTHRTGYKCRTVCSVEDSADWVDLGGSEGFDLSLRDVARVTRTTNSCIVA